MAAEAFVTPQVLRWARERDQLAPETVARRVNVDPSVSQNLLCFGERARDYWSFWSQFLATARQGEAEL